MGRLRLNIGKENSAMLVCPSCGKKATGKVEKFKGRTAPLKIKCTCGEIFDVSFEFRRARRKEGFLRGYYVKIPKGEEKGRIRVRDISLGGARFTTWEPHKLKEGDEIEFKCSLDDSKESDIERIGTVRWVNDNMIGCEFTDNREFDADLGFYFMS